MGEDAEDGNDIFDLGDDDDDDDGTEGGRSDTAADVDACVGFEGELTEREGMVLSSREEGDMTNDPYNPNDWDFLGPDQLETGELLYGGLENQDDVLNEEGENGNNSLEDCDLEGVDDILREKGRIGVFEASSAPEREIEGDASRCHGPSITTPNDEGQPARDGQTERVETMKVSNLNARGTGANAANTLKATTAPSLIARVRSPRPFGGAGHQAKAISDEGEESAQMTDVRSRSDGVLNAAISGTALHSPTRRKPTATPFIQAKGLTLTLAQAKLFGLARNINDSSAPIPLATILKAHAGGVACHENGTLLSSREHYERTRRSKGYRRGGRRRNRTYSPSRMEELARPVPGRGRVSNEEICGNEETGPRARSRRRADDPSFTWKRTRRAEAAMRDPACGYDFVREGNGDGRDAFLRRVEAHSLHCRTRLEFQRASDLYDARLDKLECPKCQNPQSYDEFSSKKVKCPSCEMTYRMPKTWNRRTWDQRNATRAAKCKERQVRLTREAAEDFHGRQSRHTRHSPAIRHKVGQVGFMYGMARDLHTRRARQGAQEHLGKVESEDAQPRILAAAAVSVQATRPSSAPPGCSTKT